MTEKLKDCPFCGGKAEIINNQDGNIFQVHCPVCGGHNLWSVNATELWNKRTHKDTSLKPCPICGHKGKLWQAYDSSFCVQCSHCGLTSKSYKYSSDARAVWNARPFEHD